MFSPDTYHVVSATIVSSNETTICLECSFRHNSSSTGCYAVFHPINHTGGVGVSYHKIIKSLVDTTASDCINTLPNGVYSVSVLDVLSYEEGSYNNTAVTISSLITINKTTSTSMVSTMILIPTTTKSNMYMSVYVLVYFIPLLVDNVDSVMPSTFFIPPSLISSSSYDNPVSMATSGPPVLILSLMSSAAVIIIIMAMIVTLMSVGLYATKRKKRNIKSNVFLITIIIIITIL